MAGSRVAVLGSVLAISGLGLAARASMDWEQSRRFMREAKPARLTAASVQESIASWPVDAKLPAGRMMEKYGVPDEVAADRLVWRQKRDWTISTLYRGKNRARHGASLAQGARYEGPRDRFGDLKKLAIGVSITEDGLLMSTSDSEDVNTLAVNVAADVLEGRRGVVDAKDFYRKTLDLRYSGKSTEYTRRLMLDRPRAPRSREQ